MRAATTNNLCPKHPPCELSRLGNQTLSHVAGALRYKGGTVNTNKGIEGTVLPHTRLERGEGALFVFGDNGQHLCEIRVDMQGRPLVMVDSMWYVKTIRDLTGGDD